MERLPVDNIYIKRLTALADSFSLTQVFLVAYFAGLARTALEVWVYLYSSTGSINLFLHFPISFIFFALSIVWLICYITDYPIQNGVKIALLMLPVIILVPLVDIVIYGAQARAISYLLPEANGFRQFIFAVFTRFYANDISVGQLVVVHSTAIAAALFCWVNTRKVLAALLGWITVLAVIFFWATFPVTIRLVVKQLHSVLWQYVSASGSSLGDMDDACTILVNSDTVSSAVFILFLPAFWIGLVSSRLRGAILNNLRGKRMAHYSVMLLLGMIWATKDQSGAIPLLARPSNIIGVLIVFQAVAAAFSSAVWMNDVADLSIDKHIHDSRPIVRGIVTVHEAKVIAAMWAAIALLSGILLDPMVLMIIALALAGSWLYSMPPLRLRRFFPISLVLLSGISVLIVQAGYACASPVSTALLPGWKLLGLLVGYSLLLTFKDVGDSIGDAQGGVTTLATIFPRRRGQFLTGICVLLGAIIIVYTLLPDYIGLMVGFIGGVLGMSVILLGRTKREIPIFSVYFVLVAVLGYLIVIR